MSVCVSACVCVRGQGFNAARFKSLSNSKFLNFFSPGRGTFIYPRRARARPRALLPPPFFAKDPFRNPLQKGTKREGGRWEGWSARERGFAFRRLD